MTTKIQTLKGFRDFLPQEKRIRDYAKTIIKQTFETFGFEPLETPTLEYASLLLGKYGDEADKLVYIFEDKGKRKVGLRYDQTVPTARVLSQYQQQLPKYFRRYQIQNVFRADKPQKGRYREFTQADIDIFNTTSPLADAEILACTYAVFQNLGFNQITLQLNYRPLLIEALKPYTNSNLSVFSLIQSIDKLDKLAPNQVIAELVEKGLNSKQAQQALSQLQNSTPPQELNQIINYAKNLGVPASALKFNPTLARGLNYYTGMIFEVTLPHYSGSFAGGGRYDQLIHDLGGPNITAVGVGIGFDRTVEAIKEQNLIPNFTFTAKVLATIMDQTYLPQLLQLTHQLRQQNIATELYPQPTDNFRKQLTYAIKKGIPYALILGEEEAKQNKFTLKNLTNRTQQTLSLPQIINQLLII